MKTKPTGIQCHRPVPRVESGRGWLTTREAGEWLGIRRRAISWRALRGWFPGAMRYKVPAGHKSNYEWRIPVADVQALIPQGPCLGYLVDEGEGENRKTYCAECGGVPTWA